MCIHQKYVFNKSINRYVFVKCGKCESCRQEKADFLANKIRHQHRKGYVHLFFHLTYCNDCVPYIRKSEIKFLQKNNHKNYYINIYRDSDNYRAKDSVNTSSKKRILFKTEVIDRKFISRCNSISEIVGLQSMTNNKDKDKVAVIYYKDFQDYFKRLKEYVKYHYPDSLGREDTKFFVVSEYGETFTRCHFHVLLEVKESSVNQWKDSIAENWLFDDNDITRNHVEVAFKAEDYCASYVNCDTIVCPFLRKNFPIVRRHSLFFGRENKAFTLPSILSKIYARDLRYDRLCRVSPKCYDVKSVSIPSYVTNYWFPKFKGFSKLSYQEIYELLSCPSTIYKYASRLGLNQRSFDRHKSKPSFLVNQVDKFLNYVDTCVSRYYEDSNYMFDDSILLRVAYATDYVCFYQAKNSTLWKIHYEQLIKNPLESYINLDSKEIRHPIFVDKALYNLSLYRSGSTLDDFNPNNFPSTVYKTQESFKKYTQYCKKHDYKHAISSITKSPL